MARQRVDNFAAGFVKAGRVGGRRRGATTTRTTWCVPCCRAAAASSRPGDMPRRPMATPSVSRAPVVRATSPRWIPSTPGGVSPDRSCSRRGLPAGDVLRSARGTNAVVTVPVDPATFVPSLMGTGLILRTPVLRSTAAGRSLWYRIPVRGLGRGHAARWDGGERPLGPARSTHGRQRARTRRATRLRACHARAARGRRRADGAADGHEVDVGPRQRAGDAGSLPADRDAPRQGRRGLRRSQPGAAPVADRPPHRPERCGRLGAVEPGPRSRARPAG